MMADPNDKNLIPSDNNHSLSPMNIQEDDAFFAAELGPERAPEEKSIAPVDPEKRKRFLSVLQSVLPFVGTESEKVVLAEVMIALKLEGTLGKDLNREEAKMVDIVKDAIMAEPEKRAEALQYAQKLLSGGKIT